MSLSADMDAAAEAPKKQSMFFHRDLKNMLSEEFVVAVWQPHNNLYTCLIHAYSCHYLSLILKFLI